MDKAEDISEDNAVNVLNAVSKLVQGIEIKVSSNTSKIKECKELKLLKEKCCSSEAIVSFSAFYGVVHLVRKKYLIGSQTISILISLLPAVHHYGSIVAAIGEILLLDLQEQIKQKNFYQCPYVSGGHKHPLIVVLKHDQEKTWFEIYNFALKLMQHNDVKVEHKLSILQPIFRQIFWTPNYSTHLQVKFFNLLLMNLSQTEVLNFTQEILMWKDVDIYYCIYLQEFFSFLIKMKTKEIISAWTPNLAVAIKWLIQNGHDPSVWLNLLETIIKIDNSANSSVLYLISDVIMETPSSCINALIGLCKSIIFSSSCNKYVAYKFAAIALNWFINPSALVHPVYKTLEEILKFLNEKTPPWNDASEVLRSNKYYSTFGSTNKNVKFAVDLILLSNSWNNDKNLVLRWLKNLCESNQQEILWELHTFFYGIILCEKDIESTNLCLDVLLNLLKNHGDMSFSFLCLVFYILGRENDPLMQKTYLFILPKLAVKKENIPLIIGIIESIRKGNPKILTPLVIQLYLSLWKFDKRTYSYLHTMLHDSTLEGSWELNVSKGIALKEICRVAPHLHAKDLVGVLSKILNECTGHKSGLPSAIAIEAVTELCKSYVIDVTGTWNAIQPKLRQDKRPQVIKSLCRFFGEIPSLNTPGHKNDHLTSDIVLMLWEYSFFNDFEVVKHSFQALSNFNVEDIPLKFFPEQYKVDIKMPKSQDKNSKNVEDLSTLSYVPAQCWVQFLQKINKEVVPYGGDMLIVLMERELSSLPRGLFYLPPEKSEPLSYSYLPPRSICRALVETLQKTTAGSDKYLPLYIMQIIRILSHEYSKLLPPLNWSFIKNFIGMDSDILTTCLGLLAKQGVMSGSARLTLEDFLKTANWNDIKPKNIIHIYDKLSMFSKAVSHNVLQNFLENTIKLFLQSALESDTDDFGLILDRLSKVLKNSGTQPAHKTLIVRQLEKILVMIPPNHKVMESYALCAIEFPVQIIEAITSKKDSNESSNDNTRRSIIIRRAIALRPDIKNPLAWLNELMEIVTGFPSEQSFILETIWTIIRSRRDCNHTTWFQELIWRIQVSMTDSQKSESNEVSFFLFDIFISATIVLSGCDLFFDNITEFTTNKIKKLEIFPLAIYNLLHFEQWIDLLPKVSQWLSKFSKWKELPIEYYNIIFQCLLTLKEDKFFSEESAILCLFNSYTSSCTQ